MNTDISYPSRYPGFTVDASLYGMSTSATSAVNSAALQAAINVAQPLKARVLIRAALAAYALATGVTIGVEGQRYTAEIVGESWNGDIGQSHVGGVNLVLEAANVSMFSVASTAAPCRFENLNMQGQKALQTGITEGGSDKSYAVWFVDYTTDAVKQRSGHFYNCRIEDFASGGVRVGLLRNAGSMERVTILNNGRKLTGQATAGAASTITLAVGSSAVDDFYNGMPILIASDTGVGQMRVISDYVGSTRVATVSVAWEVVPDNTSDYQIGLVLADGVVFGSCNDWRMRGVDCGGNTRNGYYHTGAGSITYDVACNTFTNWANGLQADSTALDMQYIGGSIDTNYGHGVWSRGSVDSKYHRTFQTVRFNQNGLGAHNTFDDVKVSDDNGVAILGCTFLKGSAEATNSRYPKHMVETTGSTTKVRLSNPIYDTANLPWTTARTNAEKVFVGLMETGIYTPTTTNIANLAGKTVSDIQWMRLDAYVDMWWRVIIDPTLAAPTATQLDFSVPPGLESDFTAPEDVSGVAVSGAAAAAQAGHITADTTNNRLMLQYKATDTANVSLYCRAAYKLK